jgi:hypothetical protein
MKSSNLAWRIEWLDEPAAPAAQSAARSVTESPRVEAAQRARPGPRFERRTIEIRDQGFEPFRIR